MGLRVLLVTSEWPSPERPASGPWLVQQVACLRELGVEVDVVSFRGARRPGNYLRARKEARGRLRTQTYDLVHAHFGHSAFMLLPLRVPLIVTFHGSDLLGIVGRKGRYTPAGWVLRRMSRFVARRATKVIVTGSNLVERLPRGVDYIINPMGVNLELFRDEDRSAVRRRIGLDAAVTDVLFSGSPSVARKRYPLAQQAIELLKDDIDVRLLVVDGQPHDAVRDHMNAADVLLVTARHETGPTTVKEALACNLPVVSVDVGDVRRWIDDLPGCEVCSDDDPQTIADALRRVLARTEPFAGRRVAETELDERLLSARVKAVYDAAVAEGSTLGNR